MLVPSLPAWLRQIVAFGCVGVAATVVHYLVALTTVEHLDVNVFFSNIMGYLCAVLISLFGHSIFTYRKKINRKVVLRFVVVSLSTLAASEGILWCLESVFAIHHRVSLGIIVLTIPVISFFLNKFWVYSASHADIEAR